MLLISMFIFMFGAQTSIVSSVPSDVSPSGIHSSFDEMLGKYVDTNGNVDYAGFKTVESSLDDYLTMLSAVEPSATEANNVQLVYWINLYNASTIKLILDNYPVSSIMEISSGKPWDKSWINVSGNTYSLNQIENEIIRPRFKESRIHFAVNCAANSCPPLMNRAWDASTLEQDLEARAKQFINDSSYNAVNENNINISKIFDWYKSDFGDILRYINKYSNVDVNSAATISYSDYDWNLNKQ